jgi:hypothetical protein
MRKRAPRRQGELFAKSDALVARFRRPQVAGQAHHHAGRVPPRVTLLVGTRPKVIGRRGTDDYLLVETRAGWGRVWDVRRNVLGPEQRIADIAKFGYWEPVEAGEDAENEE